MKTIQLLMIILLVVACQSKSKLSHEEKMIKKIEELEARGYDIIDHHAHLKGGLTMEQLLEHSEKTGISYGVAVNCGWGFPVQTDCAQSAYYHKYKDYPTYTVVQAEGREWVDMFHPDTIALFDYAFTDALAESGKALEINSGGIPSARFIRLAKANGVKFTLGTNNGNADLAILNTDWR